MPISEEGIRKLLKLYVEDGSEEAVEAALRRLMRSAEEKRAPKGSPTELSKKLQGAYAVFNIRHKFSSGQMVQWKTGMKNRRRPFVGQPAIVMESLMTPQYDISPSDSSAATPYFREPLDLILGLLDSDGDFLVFHFDSRRFEPFVIEEG